MSTSGGETPYNHFTLLADAFLKGKLFITGNYPWLEKVPINGDITNFFVVNPPMPAILSIPFVFIFGKNFPQQYLAHLIGAGFTVLTFFLSLKVKKDLKLAVWSTLLVGLGSIVWFLSSVGSTWYLGQIVSCFFLTIALIETLGKKRPIVLGISLAFVYLSRSHLALTFPIFLYLSQPQLFKKGIFVKKFKKFMLFATPIGVVLVLDMLYNYARYHTLFNSGYFLIPGTSNEPWFSKGIMHPSYILADLKIAFLAMPIFLDKFPYIQPSWAGMAIWLTTPAFFFALKAQAKEKLVKYVWLAILLVFLVVGAHGGTGFAQFGYRFAVDFYPFLILLTIKGVAKQKGPRKIHWMLMCIGILVNLWGVIWINKFGWVGW